MLMLMSCLGAPNNEVLAEEKQRVLVHVVQVQLQLFLDACKYLPVI